jgi:hypothetical protein
MGYNKKYVGLHILYGESLKKKWTKTRILKV